MADLFDEIEKEMRASDPGKAPLLFYPDEPDKSLEEKYRELEVRCDSLEKKIKVLIDGIREIKKLIKSS